MGRESPGGNGGGMAVWALEGAGNGNSGRGSLRERRESEVPP